MLEVWTKSCISNGSLGFGVFGIGVAARFWSLFLYLFSFSLSVFVLPSTSKPLCACFSVCPYTRERMGGCQNHGAFLGTLNTRCRTTMRTQKGTLILTTTHMGAHLRTFPSQQRTSRGSTLSLCTYAGDWGVAHGRNGRVSGSSGSLPIGPHSSSFLGLPYGILNMNPKKKLLWGLWVGACAGVESRSRSPEVSKPYAMP